MLKKYPVIALTSLSLLLTVSMANAGEQKIISVGSAVTELLLALGEQEAIAAVDVTSELPVGVSRPVVGYHRQLSSEGLLATGATQLIGSDEMGPASTLTQLKAAGMQVAVVNTEPTPQGLFARIDQLAALTDTQAKAQTLKQQLQTQLDQLAKHQPPAAQAKKVLFLLIHDGRAANVAGKHTTPDEIIRLAGAVNPAAATIDAYRAISNEALIEMQPDVVLLSERSFQQLGGIDATLKALPMLAATPAGKNGQIWAIDGHALVGGLGLKSVAEATRINQRLYP